MSRSVPPVIVVPRRPGPLLEVAGRRPRDEIDEALDDVFGAVDDRGPGVADAVLIAGGAVLVVAGLIASWPSIAIAAGLAAMALGAILPIRSAWRRLGARRRDAARAALRTDGVLLRVSGGPVADLVGCHDRVRGAAAGRPDDERQRVESVAHAAIREVATLLAGRDPSSAAELEYVSARIAALGSLAEALATTGVERAAEVAARHEVEQVGGSSLDDAAIIVEEIRRDADR